MLTKMLHQQRAASKANPCILFHLCRLRLEELLQGVVCGREHGEAPFGVCQGVNQSRALDQVDEESEAEGGEGVGEGEGGNVSSSAVASAVGTGDGAELGVVGAGGGGGGGMVRIGSVGGGGRARGLGSTALLGRPPDPAAAAVVPGG